MENGVPLTEKHTFGGQPIGWMIDSVRQKKI
jgi:hypothetical protein